MFSIIIPLYNKASYIQETINSVLNQTFTDYEVLVVNDSSTDDSLNIVNNIKDPRIFIFTKVNEGVSSARNFGLMKATRKYIAFLDADDVWHRDYLETVNLMINNYPEIKLFTTSYNFLVEGKLKVINKSQNKNNDIYIIYDYFKTSYKRKSAICWTSATCIEKSVFNEVDGFPVGIKRGEDLDMWLRVALHVEKLAYCSQPKAIYRLNSINSAAKSYISFNESFPYWQWFEYKSNSKYYRKYINLMIYNLANSAYNNNQFEQALDIISHCRGHDYYKYICVLRFKLFIKKYFFK